MGEDKSRRVSNSIMKKYLLFSLFPLLFLACHTPNKQSIQASIQNSLLTTENYAKIHNQLREQHFQGHPLLRNSSLERDAQNYANYLAQTGKFSHDPTNRSHKYGENLYAFSRNTTPNLKSIIQKWYNEQQYYNYSNNKCKSGEMCGHYTQIIWKTSQKIGCASAQYQKGRFKGGYVTVCKYYPYGNIVGKRPY